MTLNKRDSEKALLRCLAQITHHTMKADILSFDSEHHAREARAWFVSVKEHLDENGRALVCGTEVLVRLDEKGIPQIIFSPSSTETVHGSKAPTP